MLAGTEEWLWDQALVDGELAALAQRQRFLDDLRRSWLQRRRRRLPPLLGDDARAAIMAAVARLSTPDDGPSKAVPAQRS
jgi:hypothetical protein